MNPDVEGKKRNGYGHREGVVLIPPCRSFQDAVASWRNACSMGRLLCLPGQGRAGQGIAAVQFPFPWGWHEEIHP